ncbi:hypothetical protein MAUB1S_04649 [Mycolicibacterium aubagnense]
MPALISDEQKNRDREALLDAAHHFYERGIQAVGMMHPRCRRDCVEANLWALRNPEGTHCRSAAAPRPPLALEPTH